MVSSPLCKKWSKQQKHPDENTINWYIVSPSLACATQSRRTACKFQKKPLEVFFKKNVLKNFAKFTGKHLCQSLFCNKVAGCQPANLLKKRLWHWCFPMNFTKFLRTPFLIEDGRWLLLFIYMYRVYSLALKNNNITWMSFLRKLKPKNVLGHDFFWIISQLFYNF